MKSHYIKTSSIRHTNSSAYSNHPILNKNQLTSRVKVIEFLKDHLYPTGKEFLDDFFIVLHPFL